MSLVVDALGPSAYHVTGGRAPHRVEISNEIARCDCADHQYRKRACKHIRAVQGYLAVALSKGTAIRPVAERDSLPSNGDPPSHDVLGAIERDTVSVLDRCGEKLERLEGRTLQAVQSNDVMRKYREARARLAAQRTNEAA